jgi:hypothetical protein
MIALINGYAVVRGVREGLIGKKIARPTGTIFEGAAAVRYGWLLIIGGSLITLVCLWTLWRALHE